MSTRGKQERAALADRMMKRHGIDITSRHRSERSGHHTEPQKNAHRKYARKLDPFCVAKARIAY